MIAASSNLRLATSNGEPIPQPRVAQTQHPTVGSVGMADTLRNLSDWRTWLTAGYATKTVDYYWAVVFRYLQDVPVPLEDHTEADAAAWLEKFPYRSASRRSYYNALLNLFSWAERNGHITTNPVRGIRVPAPMEKVPRALTPAQYAAVRDAAYARSPMRGYTVELLYYSAARVNELLNLRWEDVTDDGIILRVTKSGHERLIPWCDGLHRAIDGLRGYFGERPSVLPRSQQTVWLWVRTAGTDAGVADVHPHLFRSTAATRSLVNGARPHAVRTLLGHAKIQTTTRYWAVEQADVQEAVNLL